MDLAKIKGFLSNNQYPDYRFRQILTNYYSGRFSSFQGMSDLPLNLRQQLDSDFGLLSVKLDKIVSSPSTIKARLVLSDGQMIESVLMDYGQWHTICLSSQVGCPLGCTFCATGKMGFRRNLTSEEIVDQILFWKNYLATKQDSGVDKSLRLVFMGMGEPFLNWDNLIASLDIIKNKLNIGSRKISISTAGVVPRIYDFANLDTEINLAISLHSADQSTRQQIMPIARQYSLDELLKSLEYYVTRTRRQVFFEYLLASGVNDTPHHLKLLIEFIQSHKLFYLNLIPLNPIKGGLVPSTNLQKFSDGLSRAHVNFSIRHSLGQSIDSACGQLIIK